MNTYQDLYRFAGELEQAWSAAESVDWQEAEDLVALVRQMLPEDRGELQEILDYAGGEADWDSEEAASWPSRITDYLDSSDKVYRYRPAGNDWEIYGLQMSGTEDWVATVSTETVAELLVDALSSRSTQVALPSRQGIEAVAAMVELGKEDRSRYLEIYAEENEVSPEEVLAGYREMELAAQTVESLLISIPSAAIAGGDHG